MSHPESRKIKIDVRPEGLMFNIWAMDKSTDSKGTSMLIRATHHLHCQVVLYEQAPPIPALVSCGEYRRYHILSSVYEAMTNAEENGLFNDAMTNDEIVQDLMIYCPQFEDESEADVMKGLIEWRKRKTLEVA